MVSEHNICPEGRQENANLRTLVTAGPVLQIHFSNIMFRIFRASTLLMCASSLTTALMSAQGNNDFVDYWPCCHSSAATPPTPCSIMWRAWAAVHKMSISFSFFYPINVTFSLFCFKGATRNFRPESVFTLLLPWASTRMFANCCKGASEPQRASGVVNMSEQWPLTR